MHRFFTGDVCAVGGVAALLPDEAKHATQVLRLSVGEEIVLLNGLGGVFSARIEMADKQSVTARIAAVLPDHEPRLRVTLYQGVAKGEKMELIVQKATELGVHAIQPVLFKRCVAQVDAKDAARKQARLKKIAEEAVKQCGRGHVPLIGLAQPLDKLIPRIASHACAIAPWEEAREGSLHEALAKAGDQAEVALIIGPEGGIAPEEMEAMLRHGVRPVTLGPRILRTETAGMVALAIMLHDAGDMA